MFIKLTVNEVGAIGGREQGKPALINAAHIIKITRDDAKAPHERGSKITYTNGATERVYESMDMIDKLIAGEAVGAYHDPTEPDPRKA